MPLGAGEMIEENLNGQDEVAERAAELGRYALLLELETRGGIVCELCTDLRSDGDAMFRAALPAVPLDRPALLLGFPFRGFPLRGFPLRVFL